MDTNAIRDLYARAQSLGYSKDINSFHSLLKADSAALDDCYNYVKSKGYNKSMDEFKSLIGISGKIPEPSKKKEASKFPVAESGTVSASAKPSSGLSLDDPFSIKKKTENKFQRTLKGVELGLSPIEVEQATEQGIDIEEYAKQPTREVRYRPITIAEKTKDFALTPELYEKNKDKIESVILPPEANKYLDDNKIDVPGQGMYRGGKVVNPDLKKKLKAWYALNPAGQKEYQRHEEIISEGAKIIEDAEKRVSESIEIERQKWMQEMGEYASSMSAETTAGVKSKPLKLRVLEAEQEKIEQAKKAFDTYKDSRNAGTATQIWNQISRLSGETVEDIVTFGISPLMKDLTFMEIKKKEDRGEKLTDAEKEMQRTGAYAQYVVDTYSGEATFAQDGVTAIMGSLPYMAGFVTLGGGIARPLLKTTTGAARAGVRLIQAQGLDAALARTTGSAAMASLNVAGKLTAAIGARPAAFVTAVVDNVAKAGVQTLIDPRTYNKVIENVTGTYGYNVDEKGRVTYTGMEGDMNFTQALTNAYTRQMVENLSEYSGEVFQPVGRLMRNKIPALAKMARGPKFTGMTKKFMDAAGFNGMPAEFFEEQLATIGHAIMGDGDGDWSDLIDPRQQLLTLATVAAIGSGASLVSGVERGVSKKITESAFKGSVQRLKEQFGDEFIEIGKSLTTHGVDANMASLTDLLQNPDLTGSQKAAAYDYYISGARYFAYRENEDARDKDMTEKEKLTQMRNEQILNNVVSANKGMSYEQAVEIANAEIDLRDLADNKTESANVERQKIKTYIQDAIQKSKTEGGVLRYERPKLGLQEVGQRNAEEKAPRTREEIVKGVAEADTEMDVRIAEAQQRLGLPTVVPVAISEDTEVTLDMLDNEEPVANEFIEKASEELYAKYKELEVMQQSDKREFTVEQIESMKEFIGEEITKLENYATRQKEKGEFVGKAEVSAITERGAAEAVEQPEVAPVETAPVKTETTPPPAETAPVEQKKKARGAGRSMSTKEIENPNIRKEVLQSLKLTFPDVDVIVADNEEDAKTRVKQSLINKGSTEEEAEKASNAVFSSRGSALSVNGKPAVIFLNKQMMNNRTLGHEYWHMILNEAFGNNPDMFMKFKNSIDKRLRDNGFTAVAEKLQQFSNQYENEESFEEYLSELGGYLVAEGMDIENLSRGQKTIFTQIKELINKFSVRLVGSPLFMEDADAGDILDFMVYASQKMKAGVKVDIKVEQAPETGEKGVRTKQQIIGRIGMMALDRMVTDGELIPRIKQAEKMEKDLKGLPKDDIIKLIWTETGLERGKDKKWRFEIVDPEFNVDVFNEIPVTQEDSYLMFGSFASFSTAASVRDIIDEDSAILIAYPELAEYKVVRERLASGVAGYFNQTHKVISISNTNKNPELTFLHELQHAIQYIEGFATGSNMSKAKNKISNSTLNKYRKKAIEEAKKEFIYANSVLNMLKKLKVKVASDTGLSTALIRKKNSINALKDSLFELYNDPRSENKKWLVEQADPIEKKIDDAISEMTDAVSFATGSSKDSARIFAYNLYSNSESPLKTIIVSAIKEMDIALAKASIKIDEIKNSSREEALNFVPEDVIFDYYERVAGEVEARNVQTRAALLSMGDKQEMPLSESEDTSRESQIIIKQQKPSDTKYEKIPGYAGLRASISNIILDTFKMKGTKETALTNAMSFMQNHQAYKAANDSQREEMVLDLKRRLEIKIERSPSAKRLLGIKDAKQITVDEYDMLKERLRSEIRGVKNYIAAQKKMAAEIYNDLKEMIKTGDITQKQATAILRKYNNTNLMSEESVDKFLLYVEKVFNDADYAEKMKAIKEKKKIAIDNVKHKLGADTEVINLLLKLFAMNPEIVPNDVFDSYLNIVNRIGANRDVIQPGDRTKLKDDVMAIMDAVVNEGGRINSLAMQYADFEEKVTDEETGLVSFSKTISAMLNAGVITKEQYDLMRENRTRIVRIYREAIETEEDRKAKETDSEERKKEKEEEEKALRRALINMASSIEVEEDNLLERDQRDRARELLSLRISKPFLENLSTADLKILNDVLINIRDGFFANSAEKILERLKATKKSIEVANTLRNIKPGFLSGARVKLRAWNNKQDQFYKLIESNPLGIIDEALGNFKGRQVYDAFFKDLAAGFATYKSQYDVIQAMLDKSLNELAASVKGKHNKMIERQFNMMAYALQREYETNEGNKQVSSAVDIIEATIKHIKSNPGFYGDREVEILKDILTKFKKNDKNLDSKAMYNAMNSAEKKFFDEVMPKIRGIISPKAAFTAGVIRDDSITLFENHIHHSVLGAGKESSEAGRQKQALSDVEKFMNAIKPSSKSEALIERDGKVHPLMFNVFSAVSSGAKSVLLDYYLTAPARIATRVKYNLLADLTKQQEREGVTSEELKHIKEIRSLVGAIDTAVDKTIRSVVLSAIGNDTQMDRAINEIVKQGYRAMLASGKRWLQEMMSNIAYAIPYKKNIQRGLSKEVKPYAWTHRGRSVMENCHSTETTRGYSANALSGRFVESNAIGTYYGVKQGRTKSPAANAILTWHNNSTKKVKNLAEATADILVSTPDKMLSRIMWFGSFDMEFEKLSGERPDLEKIENNDEEYMLKFADQIRMATEHADLMMIRSSGADNPFLGIIKTTITEPSDKWLVSYFKTFDKFLLNFQMFEFTAVRAGIMNAIDAGIMTRAEGVKLAAAAFSRSAVYVTAGILLTQQMFGLADIIASLVKGTGGDDDEKSDDDKTFWQATAQGLTNAFISMMFGRNLGNAYRGVVNYPIERLNEEYFSGLFRSEYDTEYDMYRDAVTYSFIPTGDLKGKKIAWELAQNTMGPYQPMVRAVSHGADKLYYLTSGGNKQKKAYDRAIKDVAIRLPIETLGTAGYLPLYKDIRMLVNGVLYEELRKSEKSKELTPEQILYLEKYGGGVK